ncbi:MAG: MerR family transcriptional regulator [Solirubrobacterales bacterium]
MSGQENSRRVSRRVEVSIDEEQGVFMISVAAELAEMHPQTLRIYEARGLINPKRSPRNTRLYSQRDVERLRRIQQMTAEGGLNLAGVEAVLEMEIEAEVMRAELERARARARVLERRLNLEITRSRDRVNTEIIPYGAYESTVPRSRRTVRIHVDRPSEEPRKESF